MNVFVTEENEVCLMKLVCLVVKGGLKNEATWYDVRMMSLDDKVLPVWPKEPICRVLDDSWLHCV
jgi:hypothetical protein